MKYQSPIDYEIYEGDTVEAVVAELRSGCLAPFANNMEYRRNVKWRFGGVLDIDPTTDQTFIDSLVAEGILFALPE